MIITETTGERTFNVGLTERELLLINAVLFHHDPVDKDVWDEVAKLQHELTDFLDEAEFALDPVDRVIEETK